MYDKYNRHINYLRISVTDKCNCMPAEGIKFLPHEDILSYEEIAEIVQYAVTQGFEKIRLTGGEPLVRRNITSQIEMLSGIPGVNDLSMTTNGILLKDYAFDLVKAGLNRVNVSVDTLDPQKYKTLTRGGVLHKVLEGLRAAKQAGLTPIKVNMVLGKHTSEQDKNALDQFCRKNAYTLRFIKEMNLNTGTFSVVEGGLGGNCPKCNRLRLTSNGMLKSCLFSDMAYDVRELGIKEAFRQAVYHKPKTGTHTSTGNFCRIGG